MINALTLVGAAAVLIVGVVLAAWMAIALYVAIVFRGPELPPRDLARIAAEYDKLG